jgi:hypothetical protein
MARINEIVERETMTATGVGIAEHRGSYLGFPFSSLMSPVVPLALFLIYYMIFVGEFDIFWSSPLRSKIVAWDIIDCISMYDTIFAHDPYFLFEDVHIGGFFTHIYILVLAVFWIGCTFQLRYEFQDFHHHTDDERDEAKAWRVPLTVALNVCFLGLRFFLRVQAQYCTPGLVLKNVAGILIYIPALMYQQAEEEQGHSTYEGYSDPAEEKLAYKAALENVHHFVRKSLDEDKRKWHTDTKHDGRHNHGFNVGNAISMITNWHAKLPEHERKRFGPDTDVCGERECLHEAKVKLIDEFMGPRGKFHRALEDARDFAEKKSRDHDSRDHDSGFDLRGAFHRKEDPDELRIKFGSYIGSIASEVRTIEREVKHVFDKIEKKRHVNMEVHMWDRKHIEDLHRSLEMIQKETKDVLHGSKHASPRLNRDDSSDRRDAYERHEVYERDHDIGSHASLDSASALFQHHRHH